MSPSTAPPPFALPSMTWKSPHYFHPPGDFRVFAFLRNVWATSFPSVAVPLSLIGTFGVMYLCHYSVDNLSLMALTISTASSWTMPSSSSKNISRHIENGMKPYEAAMKGASEIGFTVISMSTSLVAVFIPILLMVSRRTPLPRIRRCSQRGHRRFAFHFSNYHSHDVRPLPSHETGRHNRLYHFRENVQIVCCAPTMFSLRWVLRHHSSSLVTFRPRSA